MAYTNPTNRKKYDLEVVMGYRYNDRQFSKNNESYKYRNPTVPESQSPHPPPLLLPCWWSAGWARERLLQRAEPVAESISIN